VIIQSLRGETTNAMTLGGLAFAVGILVDDATVTIENNPSDESAELSRQGGFRWWRAKTVITLIRRYCLLS
jgi:Cu/Ag efflux pump CusA